MAALQKCAAAHRAHARQLLQRRGVVMVGIGEKRVGGVRTGEIGLVVSVVEKKPANQLRAEDLIPQAVDGVATDVVQTGPIRALELSPTAKYRPAPGGVSVGHKAITAGTLGTRLRQGEQEVILSNNHVLANSNAATPGDAIYQPGPHDGGNSADEIAVLGAFVPIAWDGGGGDEPSNCPIARAVAAAANGVARVLGRRTRLQAITPAAIQAGPNLVDAAVAIPRQANQLAPGMLNRTGDIVTHTQEPVLGQAVVKSGRTTGITFGKIEQIEAMVRVGYGNGKTATFERQLVIRGDGGSEFSAGGDSGSAVLALDNPIAMVGLLFAGGGGVTIANRASDVWRLLGLNP